MAVEIKPFVVGSKKATMGLVSSLSGAGIGFVVFVICMKYLHLSMGDSLKVAGAIAGMIGAAGIQYGATEGLRDIAGKGK